MTFALAERREQEEDRYALIQDFLTQIDVEEVLASTRQDVEQGYKDDAAAPDQAPDLETADLKQELAEIEDKVKRGQLDLEVSELKAEEAEAENMVIDTLVHGMKKVVKFGYYHLQRHEIEIELDDIRFMIENSLKKCSELYQEFVDSIDWDEYCQEFYWDILVSKDLAGRIEDDPLEFIAIDSIAHGLEDGEIKKRISVLKRFIRTKLKGFLIPDSHYKVVEARVKNLEEDADSCLVLFRDFTTFETILLQTLEELALEFPTNVIIFTRITKKSPLYQNLAKYLPLIEKYKDNLRSSKNFPCKIEKEAESETILIALITTYLASLTPSCAFSRRNVVGSA